MKYISIDIETTGLDPENHSILTIGAVIEDTEKPDIPIKELPTFHALILRNDFKGSAFAINMNHEIIETMVKYQTARTQEDKLAISEEYGYEFFQEEDVVIGLFRFLWKNGIFLDILKVYNYPFERLGEVSYPVVTSKMPKMYLNIAGKNFGTFDKLFLEKLPRWKQVFRIRNRILDPAILFVDWKKDEALPGLSLCKERLGISGFVSHDAVDDARDVISLLRTQYK